jgi:hypothetical protein
VIYSDTSRKQLVILLGQLHFVLGFYYIHLVIGETVGGGMHMHLHARYAQDLRQKEEGNTRHAYKIAVWILAPCFVYPQKNDAIRENARINNNIA